MASSEIEVVEDAAAISQPAGCGAAPAAAAGAGQEGEEEPLKDDVYTGAAYGDLEKLHRLVEREGRSVTEPDGLGYHALSGPRSTTASPPPSTSSRSVPHPQHGADVNATDHTGQTALHWSAVRGHIQVAELLLKEGAKVDAADFYGYQTTHVAAQYGQTTFLCHIVAKRNADPDLPDNDGRSPLHWKDPGYIIKNIRDSQNQRDDRNKWEFFMFLILEVSAMIITGATAIIRSIGDPACPGSFGGWLTYTAINHSWVVSFVIMDSFLFFGVITLTVIQASQISSNITTNEMANALRYSYLRGPGGRFRNPFDHGVRKNCSDFFLKGYNEDIEKAEQTVRPDEEMGTIQMTRSSISQNGESIPVHVNGTDHSCADSQANSKSHCPHSPSKDCNHNKKSDKTPLGLGLGLGRNNPSSRYVRSLLPL
ncbi:hypothetical protein PR202_ga06689 [Eleusine coracana subsp. coracana]|uniref:protein S-acyltransferase n=1 Tax=Eleusine coracana subsp. coracana TaxID=191504 RepID=A0AAV5BWS2_ELECO|nr:hypothetical protein PR202_ga06689 [Eleusine coracana subsp. coracana]